MFLFKEKGIIMGGLDEESLTQHYKQKWKIKIYD